MRASCRELVTQALELAREVGDRRHVHAALDTLAWIALAEGGAGEARELFTEALSQALEIANQPAARVSLYGLAAAAAAAGDGRLVARLAASAGLDPGGSAISIDPATRAVFDRNLAEARAQTDPAEWEEAWAAGAALTVEQAAAEVLGT
ncbi:MAG TPA: hypothetical protein VKA24_06230 [Gaiellaceae bacterium]|nr:hypothetical protein [Gaiellaceae bacterium]